MSSVWLSLANREEKRGKKPWQQVALLNAVKQITRSGPGQDKGDWTQITKAAAQWSGAGQGSSAWQEQGEHFGGGSTPAAFLASTPFLDF